MYCSNCGVAAEGNYCHACGAKLAEVATGDWRQESRYDQLLRHAEVRQAIARHAAQAKQGLSGEQFIEVCDKALSPLLGGVPLGVIASLALPLWERLGVRTGKSRREFVLRPIGEATVGVLCSLGRHGQKIKLVEQLADGCVITAELPSDVRTMTGGELHVALRKQEQGTLVEAATKIPGQLYDWGKSSQTLSQLLDDVLHLPEVTATLADDEKAA